MCHLNPRITFWCFQVLFLLYCLLQFRGFAKNLNWINSLMWSSNQIAVDTRTTIEMLSFPESLVIGITQYRLLLYQVTEQLYCQFLWWWSEGEVKGYWCFLVVQEGKRLSVDLELIGRLDRENPTPGVHHLVGRVWQARVLPARPCITSIPCKVVPILLSLRSLSVSLFQANPKASSNSCRWGEWNRQNGAANRATSATFQCKQPYPPRGSGGLDRLVRHYSWEHLWAKKKNNRFRRDITETE